MSAPSVQLELLLPPAPDLGAQVRKALLAHLAKPVQPSAQELLQLIERQLGVKARWELRDAIVVLVAERATSLSIREFLRSLLDSGELDAALRGDGVPDKEVSSSIDTLLQQSKAYRGSANFAEMIRFMARFREYAPFNNMLVRLQNPACSFFATESHWRKKFHASLNEDARPMVILAPMRPVMLVYDLDQVTGAPLPAELEEFAQFKGQWEGSWLDRALENAAERDRIRVDFKTLSSTAAGFATLAHGDGRWKRRIAIHAGLDEPSRFGVLCHELAHIYLGHLGSDEDHWWPSRTNLTKHAVELEAEAVAYLVTTRLGLQGSSTAYVSRHMPDGEVPQGASMDYIAKVAGRIEQMAKERLPRRARRGAARRQG